jgi:preprotein translocase subunit SecE
MFTKIASGFAETKREFSRVNWPTRAETIRYTAVVVGISLAFAVYLGALDYVFSYLLTTYVI